MKSTEDSWTPYLLSLPERTLRSASGMAGGLLHEIGEVTLPRALRQSQLYQNLVEASLRFLIERVGQVEGVYPSEEKLAEDFLVRRTAGSGIELIGILAFRASPVWVLAALADVSGAGKFLIREISASLKEQGLLDPDTEFSTVNQMLDGLEGSAGRMASTINEPPLMSRRSGRNGKVCSVTWRRFRPGIFRLDSLRKVSTDVTEEASRQNRTVFQVSSVDGDVRHHQSAAKGLLDLCVDASGSRKDRFCCGRNSSRSL